MKGWPYLSDTGSKQVPYRASVLPAYYVHVHEIGSMMLSRPNNVDDIISMLERDKKQVVQSKD